MRTRASPPRAGRPAERWRGTSLETRWSRRRGRAAASGVVLSLALAAPAPAQEAAGETAARDRMQDLEQRIAALEARREAEESAAERQLEELASELERARVQSTAGQTLSVFNPAIAVSGTFLGREDDRDTFEDDDPDEARIDDRFSLREVEVDLRAPVGPWADGVLTLALEQEDYEFEAGIEEGYVSLRRLPLVESAPGGLKIKVGHFRVNFNRLNRVHLHNLPQPTFPRSLQTFLGYHGLKKTGVSGDFFLPSPSDSVSLHGTLEVLNGGDLPSQSTAGKDDIGFLGQLRTFADLDAARTLDLGVTAWSDGSLRSLYGTDLTYTWAPPTHGTWKSFVLGGEAFLGDFEQPGLDQHPLGYHVYGQYQFDTSTYAGVRYDHSQEIDDSDLETDIFGLYVTRYSTEFLRFRLGYERARSDIDAIDGRDTVLFEVSFTYGAHPAEPYWVHK